MVFIFYYIIFTLFFRVIIGDNVTLETKIEAQNVKGALSII